MTHQLSEYVSRIQPSPTMALNARATELRAQGKDIINLSVGEPDFDTPEHIKEAANKALREGKTKYTAVDGIPSLKEAIIEKFRQENQLDYAPNQIIVTSGAKQAIFNLCFALLNPADEAIIPAPYWVSYPDIVKITGAKPVTLTTTIEQGYKITPEQLEDAITDKTRLVFLNSPSNPSGKAYSAQELKQLAAVLLKHPQVLIISDDIYEHILWTAEPFKNIVMVCPELYKRTIIINGVSKAYAMTGWRIGYAAGPQSIIAGMKKIQSQSTSNPSSISQMAAEMALRHSQECITPMVDAFKTRHQFMYDALSNIEGFKVLPSEGTFYSFPDVQQVIKGIPNISTDIEFSEWLLNEAGIAMVPGAAFGAPGSLRISFAVEQSKLEKAIQRIQKILMN